MHTHRLDVVKGGLVICCNINQRLKHTLIHIVYTEVLFVFYMDFLLQSFVVKGFH